MIFHVPGHIDFFSVRPHAHTKKAYRTKQRKHLSQKEQKAEGEKR